MTDTTFEAALSRENSRSELPLSKNQIASFKAGFYAGRESKCDELQPLVSLMDHALRPAPEAYDGFFPEIFADKILNVTIL